jgi:transposase InsO family protein
MLKPRGPRPQGALITDFTDRLFGLRKRAATGKQGFDTLCGDFGIDHRLPPPQPPQTNGMVERFNGRIEDVLQSHHFRSGEDLNATMHRYVSPYNQHLTQSTLQSRTPLQAMKDGHKLIPTALACGIMRLDIET